MERVALDQMLAQHLRSPDAELRAAGRLYPVAHGDDHIEAVEINLAVNNPGALPKDVADVLAQT